MQKVQFSVIRTWCSETTLKWNAVIIRELKQQRFRATDVNRKWTFCSIGLWFGWNPYVNRLYRRKETQQYKFGSVQAYKKGKGLTPGWPRSHTVREHQVRFCVSLRWTLPQKSKDRSLITGHRCSKSQVQSSLEITMKKFKNGNIKTTWYTLTEF